MQEHKRVQRYTEEVENKKFHQREMMFLRNDYPAEQRVMAMIRNGEVEKLDSIAQALTKAEIKVGNMTSDNLQLDRYMGVIFIALAEREAIAAGISEGKAFDEGDSAMVRIDRSQDENEIFKITMECVCTLTRWVRELLDSQKYSRPVRKALEYIDVHLHCKISLNELAEAAGVSRSYLSGIFGTELGCTIPEYINDQRLEEAARLLRTTEETTATIANLVGFASQSYFIARFKEKYGLTPKEYKDQ